MSKQSSVVKPLHCLSLLPPKLKTLLSDAAWLAWRRTGGKLIPLIIPKHYFEKLETIKFYGMTFNVPSNAEEYLKYRYGENWRIPNKKWEWWKEDGAIKTFTA